MNPVSLAIRKWPCTLTCILMNIEEFVRDSLVQIVKGVQQAQEAVGDSARINPRFGSHNQIKWSDVSFDIAVTATESSEVSGSVRVLGPVKFGVGGGTTAADSNVSRLQFTVPLVLPETPWTRAAPNQ